MSQSQTRNVTRFGMQRCYVKKIDFELHNAPDVFTREFKPELNVGFDVQATGLKVDAASSENYEVSLLARIEVKMDKEPAFTLTLVQSGVFIIEGVTQDMLESFVSIECAHFLFPYVRETIDSLIIRSSLPPLMLPPVDFAKIYADKNKGVSASGPKARITDSSEELIKQEELDQLKKEIAMLKAQKELESQTAKESKLKKPITRKPDPKKK